MIARPFANIKWRSVFQPQRNDPDLRPVTLGFLALIVLGDAVLMLPSAHVPDPGPGWMHGFFPRRRSASPD